MTWLNDLARRSFLQIAAALGGPSTVGALPNLAGAQDPPQQTDTPAITLQDVSARMRIHMDAFPEEDRPSGSRGK